MTPDGIGIAPAVDQLDSEQVEQLLETLAGFDRSTRARGLDYVARARVGPLVAAPGVFGAEVRGSQVYACYWQHEQDQWHAQCTCPMGYECKHLYATAAALLQPVRENMPFAMRALLPRERVRWAALERPALDTLTDPDDDEHDEARTPRAHAVPAHELRRGLREWLAPPASGARRLCFLVRVMPTATGQAAVTLDPRLTSARLQNVHRGDGQLATLLQEANRDPSALEERSTRLLRAYLGTTAAWTPWRATVSVDANKLRQLLEVNAGGEGVVWDPACDPGLTSRHALSPGAPVRLAPAILRIVPAVTVNDRTPTLALSLVWPDGRTQPLADALLLQPGSHQTEDPSPALVVVGGEVYQVHEVPPPQVLEGFQQSGALALDAAEDATLLRTLAARFPDVDRALRASATVHRVEPVFVLALDDRDQLHLRLFATTQAGVWQPFKRPAAGERVFEYHGPGDWRPSDGGARRTGTGDEPAPLWLEQLAREDVEPAERWLTLSGAEPSEESVNGETPPGFWSAMYGPALDQLAAALQARPANARWFATPELQKLLAGPTRVHAKLATRASGVDLFAISAEWQAEGMKLSPADLEALRSSRHSLVRLSSGWIVRSEDEQLARLEHALADLGVRAGDDEVPVTLWQLAQASPDSWDVLCDGDVPHELREAAENLRARIKGFQGIPALEVPAGFEGELRPYQRAGVDFLAWTASLGMGAVLADDMGLGKTVQTIAWLLHLRAREPGLGPALVVAPASVVHNWKREAQRFAPHLRVAVLESGRARQELLAEAHTHDLLVTNYALLRRDIETWRQLELGVAVLDEAQNIKNPVAAISQAARELRARYRLALSGTPLENRALDLWSIMAFVNPGLLGTQKEFRSRYERADAPPFVRRLLAARVRPVLLRRLKTEVAQDLPDRIEERLDCDLHPLQHKLYVAEVREAREMIAAMSADEQGLQRGQIEILAKLTRLRQICCHPALAGASSAATSGKFEAFWELIESLHEQGEKVLVFSQFVQCLERLRAGLAQRGIANHLLTGASRNREALVAAFQDEPGPGVFLISLKAGGTGLNLTSARNVVLFDPWWNPAVEAQAIDRAHRIGQRRTVIAHRLIARGTIEERILELQAKKAELADAILGEGGGGQALTREDLDFLLSPA